MADLLFPGQLPIGKFAYGSPRFTANERAAHPKAFPLPRPNN